MNHKYMYILCIHMCVHYNIYCMRTYIFMYARVCVCVCVCVYVCVCVIYVCM